MKEIGNRLSKKRKELKLSYEDVNKITKLPVDKIKAIEAGDLDYFKNELTYVRFYVRSYCKAVDVPYENFKDDVMDSVDEFTNTMAIKKEEDRILSEESIKAKTNKGPRLAKKDRGSISQNAGQQARFRKVKKVDFSFVSLIVIIAIVLVILIYVGVNSLINNVDTPSKSENQISETIENTTPTPEVDEEKEETLTPTFTKVDANNYDLKGIKDGEKVKIEVSFSQVCFFDAMVNNVRVNNGQTQTYLSTEQPFTYEFDGKVNDIYYLWFGNFQAAQPVIKVNGVTLEYDALLANAGTTVTININMKGE